MNIIAVDDEPLALSSIVKQLETAFPNQLIRGFSSPSAALKAMREKPADVAFLDIKMAGMTGVELAMRFKEVNPPINIIFVTAYSEYAIDALKIRASGYILKPATQEAIIDEMNNLRTPGPALHRIAVRTFGAFEVFVDGEALHFARNKSRELFAILIDKRGGGIGNAEACALLWPNKAYDFSLQRQLQTVISVMLKTFSAHNAGEVIIRRRSYLAVDTNMVDCDLYNMLRGDMYALNSLQGEYMAGYEWAVLSNFQMAAKNLD